MDARRGVGIDRARIRAAHLARAEEWSRDPRPLTVRATVEVIEDHLKEARAGGFVIRSDEGPVVGGRGQAPTPLTYFVASIGFAILTDLVRAFAIHDVEVDRLGLTIEAEFPLDAKYGASSGPVAATAIRYDVAIDSGASRPAVEAAVAWAERYCHAVQTVRQPVAVVGRYRLAGEELAGF